jgi:hypothetical protein
MPKTASTAKRAILKTLAKTSSGSPQKVVVALTTRQCKYDDATYYAARRRFESFD